ncbi:hypothetical protein C5167_050253 [Papaver somniferum]|uniref:Uncharacterized protein n=1 Tax=Papaver somniferum TaxID=3469 RepID=A0A4Y7KRM5_PAPSO|nr:hypothetical protein C5167_050253 [Papaver somniferum]
MASMKAERPVGSQLFRSLKKEPAKATPGTSTTKAPSSSKSAPKKTETKPREPKKKAKAVRNQQLPNH